MTTSAVQINTNKATIKSDNFQYEQIDQLLQGVCAAYEAGQFSKEDLANLNANLGEEFMEETLHGHVLRKPFGYAGDFLIIDKIYTLHQSEHPVYKLWDQYFHNYKGTEAVRNRKTYFKKLIAQKMAEKEDFQLLNIASGPARDVKETYETLANPSTLKTTCVEMDPHAIAYAKALNGNNLKQIEFINKNIFKFNTEEKFDLIWSAGLFDYFDDKTFVQLLKRFKNWGNHGAEIVIGNFNETYNPSRIHMELFGEWYLIHRSAEQLMALAKAAGFHDHQIRIGRESENINLFLHLAI